MRSLKTTYFPFSDPNAILIVDTDASDLGLGDVLSRIGQDGIEGLIDFASRAHSENEEK